MQMFIFSWNQGEFFPHIHFPETCEGSKDTPGQETNSGGNSAFFQLNEHSVGEASLVGKNESINVFIPFHILQRFSYELILMIFPFVFSSSPVLVTGK